MKRIAPLTEATPGLAQFVADNPGSRDWDSFRHHEGRASHKELLKALRERQRGLCAYCEIALEVGPGRFDQQVEHEHPKSDTSGATNWTFEITNLVAGCTGGTQTNSFPERVVKPIKKNQSCGQFKGGTILEERALSPSRIAASPTMFAIDPLDGSWMASPEGCRVVGIAPEDVDYTIRAYNLNSPRLRNLRKAEYDQLDSFFEQELAADIAADPADILTQLAKDVLRVKADGTLGQFFTTLRLYFGQAAEDILAEAPQDWICA